jgi:phosphatidate cytidylyltransferase
VTNLGQRVLTAVIAIPAIIAATMYGGIAFFLFVALLSTLALKEFYGLTEARGAKPLTAAGMVAGIAVNCSFFHAQLRAWIAGAFARDGASIPFPSGEQLVLIVLLLAFVFLLLAELFRNNGSALLNLGATALGLLYVPLFLGTWIGVREMFTRADIAVAHFFFIQGGGADEGSIYAAGGSTVIALFAMIWCCDTAAYQVGRKIGRHKLFPRISPNKSWEGAAAGFLFSVGAAVAAKYLALSYLPLVHAIVLGCLVGTIGQLGDLTESLFKRDAGVKDSSAFIPGHGGVLDRFDSLLLVAPVVYLYLDFIVF